MFLSKVEAHLAECPASEAQKVSELFSSYSPWPVVTAVYFCYILYRSGPGNPAWAGGKQTSGKLTLNGTRRRAIPAGSEPGVDTLNKFQHKRQIFLICLNTCDIENRHH